MKTLQNLPDGGRVSVVNNDRHRQSRVINRDYVRKWALDYANINRAHPFERVSEKFLNTIERLTKDAIVERVNKHPSRGKTLM